MKAFRYIIFIPIISSIIYIVFALPPMAVNFVTSFNNFWTIPLILIFAGLAISIFKLFPIGITWLATKISPNDNFTVYTIFIITILLGIDKIIYYWTMPEINENGSGVFWNLMLTCITIGFVLSIIIELIAERFYLLNMWINFFGSIIFKIGMFLVVCVLTTKICDINPNKTYSWYYGIWHGLFVIPNWITSWFFDDIYCKASNTSTVYSFFWWIFAISSAIRFMPGGGRNKSERDY